MPSSERQPETIELDLALLSQGTLNALFHAARAELRRRKTERIRARGGEVFALPFSLATQYETAPRARKAANNKAPTLEEQRFCEGIANRLAEGEYISYERARVAWIGQCFPSWSNRIHLPRFPMFDDWRKAAQAMGVRFGATKSAETDDEMVAEDDAARRASAVTL